MKVIEFDDEMMKKYKNGERVFLYDDDNVELFIAKPRKENHVCYAMRQEGKKHGCYYPSWQDIEKFNTREPTPFYISDAVIVGIKLVAEGEF